MPEPVVLSGSSLNTFIECPKEWMYLYLMRVERKPSLKMALGTAAHYAVEVAMKEKLLTGSYPHLDVWLDAFADEWRKEGSPSTDGQEYAESGIRCVTFYAAEIAPTIEPIAVEMPIRLQINGHTWTGSIDLLAKGKTGTIIKDHKFTGERPRNSLRYRYPMIGYALGVRHQLNVIEEDVQLDYIIRNKKPVLYTVNNGGPVSDEDILDLAQQIEDAVQMISRGSFPPLGRDKGACNWCPVWAICPDYKGKKKPPTETFGERAD